MRTVYRSGGVTVELGGELEAFVRKAVEAAEGETLRILEAAAEDEAARARAQWYAPGTGVNRETGRSGDVQVTTTISADEITVSVASTDTARIRDARGRSAPRAAVIHRPGRLSLVEKRVSQGDWWAWKKAGKPVGRIGTKGKADWIVLEPNPDASDGAYLVPELIRKPVRARIRIVTPELARAIADRAGEGR